jgi:hypothetical protein
LFHSRYSPKLADFVPSFWYGREGAGHIGYRNDVELSEFLSSYLNSISKKIN